MMKLRLRLAPLLTVLLTGIAGLTIATTSESAHAVGEGSGGVFVPLKPVKLADTSTGLGSPATPIAAASSRSFKVLGVGGIPTTGVGAVVVDVSGTSSADTNLYAYGATRKSPFLQLDGDVPHSNTVVVAPDSNGKISIYSSSGNSNVSIDLQGYFTATSGEGSPGGFVAVPASRVVDTSAGIGIPLAKIGAGDYYAQISGVGIIPDDATAVFANVRVWTTSSNGTLTVGASNAAFNSSTPASINFGEGTVTDSGLAIPLGPDGRIRITPGAGANINVTINIEGYFVGDPSAGGSFTSLPGTKIFDSHESTPLAANNAVRVVTPAGMAGIPADGSVSAIMVTLTVSDWQTTSSNTQYVKIYNPDTGAPRTTSLSLKGAYGGVPVSTTAIVPLSTRGRLALQNLTDAPLHMTLSIQGWFSASDESDDEAACDPDPQYGKCLYVTVEEGTSATGDNATFAGAMDTVTDETMLLAVAENIIAGDIQSTSAFAASITTATYSSAAIVRAKQIVQGGDEAAQSYLEEVADAEQESQGSDFSAQISGGYDNWTKKLYYRRVYSNRPVGSIVSTIRADYRFYLLDYPDKQKQLSGDLDVLGGRSVAFPELKCQIKYKISFAPDPVVYKWPNCPSAEKHYLSTYAQIFAANSSFYGTRGERYYNEYKITVNPSGKKYPARTYVARRPDWKNPVGGGDPFWPSH